MHVEDGTGIATITLNRPAKLNSLTFDMYEQLHAACEVVDNARQVRALVLRGAGPAFCSGSDINWFRTFSSGEDGLDYDRTFVQLVQRVEAINVPTIAVVRGACVGAGLVIAAACDMRIACTDATFGLPIAHTLGNTLSAYPVALLAERLGSSRLMSLVASGEYIDAQAATDAGFVTETVSIDQLRRAVADLATTLGDGSDFTVIAFRKTLARIRATRIPDTSDLVHQAYSSPGFHAAVQCFTEGLEMDWRQMM